MKVIITGGAGPAGCKAASHYLRQGANVVVIDDLSGERAAENLDWLLDQGRLEFVQLDLRDSRKLAKVLREHYDADRILHFKGGATGEASVESPEEGFPVNGNGIPHGVEGAPVKVLQVGKFYPPSKGGIETHLETLCQGLRKSVDLEAVVASHDGAGREETVDGVRVSRMPTALSVASAPFCPKMVEKIRRSGADIVHLHLPNPSAVLAYLASGYTGHLVVTYHSDTVRQKILGSIFEPFLLAALNRSSAIITTSENYQRSSPVLSRYSDRCHIVPLGVAVEKFERTDRGAVEELRRKYGERVILSVGRLVYYKGFEYLIQAMRQVEGTLVLVGDGPLRGKLQALAKESGVNGKVVFTGELPDEAMAPHYHAADVFVLPSIARSEAFGVVQIEAMAAGKPVVNTQLDSGVPYVSVHQQTGLTVPPGDAGALASAMNHLLNDDNLRKKLGCAARERARREFALETMISRTMAVYDSVLKRSSEVEAAVLHP